MQTTNCKFMFKDWRRNICIFTELSKGDIKAIQGIKWDLIPWAPCFTPLKKGTNKWNAMRELG